jgi:hypothetical protein
MLAMLALWGCGTEGCLDGQEDCRVAPPCADIQFSCTGGEAVVERVEAGAIPQTGNNAVGSPGDWMLRNRNVLVVISDLDHPHFIAPTGGNIVDVATWTRDGNLRQDDSVRNVYQVGGLLPDEAMAYHRITSFMDGDHAVVQVEGTYDDDPDVLVYTRYELGPCDPGVRIRTEVVNRHDEPESILVADVHYIGSREHISFAPGPDGLDHPSFGLTTLADGLREVPFVAAGAHEAPGLTALSFTACDDDSVTALLSEELSAIGKPPTLLPSGDFLTYERFLGIGHGGSIAAGADIAYDVRAQLHDEPFTTVTGRISHDRPVDMLSGRPQLVIHEGDVPLDAPPEDTRTVTHVEPDRDGLYSFVVPTGGTYTAHVERFGLPWARATFDARAAVATVDVALPAAGRVGLDVTIDGEADHALVIVWPADEATRQAVEADYLDHFQTCGPMLGHPFGAAPSCNRILVDGSLELDLPPGTYDFHSVAGPFTTQAIARDVVVPAWDGGEVPRIALDVETLRLLRPGSLTADFHVHGSASFDASIPDGDRVRAMLASRVDVIAATDHDKVHDYAETVAELGTEDRLKLLIGLETTGHILQPLLATNPNPKVIGHWIVWPLAVDPEGPWRGAPWDEKALPGELFTRFEDAGWPAATGVIQLNHPSGGSQFGRDFGWATALEMDLTRPLYGDDAPEGHHLFRATPEGARFANDAYHVQEVMNGTDNGQFEAYRAVWHYLLDEGTVKAGTANSDSHSLGGNVLGFPLNVVRTGTSLEDFDQPTFNASVREGRMFGTNGPVLDVRIERGEQRFEPSLTLALPPDGLLVVEVSAADWVPVDEVRIVVNSAVVHTEPVTLVDDPDRPGVRTARLELSVDGLVPFDTDSWMSVEAGVVAPLVADLDCDGVPDTGDTNGDGRVDWRDVDDYASLDEAPQTALPDCYPETGPLRPDDATPLPENDYQAVVPEGYPLAFTNPFLFDGDGDDVYGGVPR